VSLTQGTEQSPPWPLIAVSAGRRLDVPALSNFTFAQNISFGSFSNFNCAIELRSLLLKQSNAQLLEIQVLKSPNQLSQNIEVIPLKM